MSDQWASGVFSIDCHTVLVIPFIDRGVGFSNIEFGADSAGEFVDDILSFACLSTIELIAGKAGCVITYPVIILFRFG